MSIKQRYQNVILGDTVRLQNFLLDNAANDSITKIVPKVEIYRKKPSNASNNNPRGIALKKTVVYRPGFSGNDISASPSANNPDFWELMLGIDPDQWEIDNDPDEEHIDRWYLITDPNADLANPVVVNPYSPSDDYYGTIPTNAIAKNTTLSIAGSGGAVTIGVGYDFSIGSLIRLAHDGGDAYIDAVVTSYENEILQFLKFASKNRIASPQPSYNSWTISELKNINVANFTASLYISNGLKNLPIAGNIGLGIGDKVQVVSTNDPETFMVGEVDSFSASELNITVTMRSSPDRTTPTWYEWDVNKIENRHAGIVNFREKVRKGRRIKPSGIGSSSYTMAQLISDLKLQISVVPEQIIIADTSGNYDDTGNKRTYVIEPSHMVALDGKRANASDAAWLDNTVVEDMNYTMYGSIVHETTVVGYFQIRYNQTLGSQAITITGSSTAPPSIPMPVDSILPIGSISSIDGAYLDPTIEIPWVTDPTGQTSLENVRYAKLVDIPSQVYSAANAGIVGYAMTYESIGSRHVDESVVGIFSLNSSDGGKAWSGSLYPLDGSSLLTASAVHDADNLNVSVDWNIADGGAVPPLMKAKLYDVEEWNVEAPYESDSPNPWDDLVLRTHPTMLQIVEHTFRINPSMYISSSRPIVSDWNFSAVPNTYYVNTRTWMRVTVTPDVPLNPETQRFHYGLLSAGSLRYQVYRVSSDGADTSRMIAEGPVYWFEKNVGLFRLDTRTPPYNRSQACFVVFFVDLPDGTNIRSARIFFNITDDLRRGVLAAYGRVF